MAVTVSAGTRLRGPNARVLIRGAAACAALGVALSITDYVDYGKWLVVLGVLLLIVALHRFGRLGADEPMIFIALASPRRKKKKRKKLAAEDQPEPTPDL